MSEQQSDFQSESEDKRPSLAQEFVGFLLHNKKWWLAPIVVCLALLTFLAFFAGSGAAPFIYTIF